MSTSVKYCYFFEGGHFRHYAFEVGKSQRLVLSGIVIQAPFSQTHSPGNTIQSITLVLKSSMLWMLLKRLREFTLQTSVQTQ